MDQCMFEEYQDLGDIPGFGVNLFGDIGGIWADDDPLKPCVQSSPPEAQSIDDIVDYDVSGDLDDLSRWVVEDLLQPQRYESGEDLLVGLGLPVATPVVKTAEVKIKHSETLKDLLLKGTPLKKEPQPLAVSIPSPSLETLDVFPSFDHDLNSTDPVLDVDINTKFIEDSIPSPDSLSSLSDEGSRSPKTLSDFQSTVDLSSLYSVNSSSDLYKVVTNDQKKLQASPYNRSQCSDSSTKSRGRKRTASISNGPSDLDYELMSKKDRKKLQNKNAAVRYRMKKKEEADMKKSEVEELEVLNKNLHDKVNSLTHEVQYMKNLINEVRKKRKKVSG